MQYVLPTDAITRLGEQLVKAPGLVGDASGQPVVNPTYARTLIWNTTGPELAGS